MLISAQAGVIIAAFLCSLFFSRAHTTFYLVNAALALIALKSVWFAMTPRLYVPPIPPGSALARILAIVLSTAFATVFWRHAFGKPSRDFYGLRNRTD